MYTALLDVFTTVHRLVVARVELHAFRRFIHQFRTKFLRQNILIDASLSTLKCVPNSCPTIDQHPYIHNVMHIPLIVIVWLAGSALSIEAPGEVVFSQHN